MRENNMNKKIIYAILVSLLLAYNYGAGRADDGTNSGVSKEKILHRVTKEESNKMCKLYAKMAKKIEKANCTLDGLKNGKNESECKTIEKECLNSYESRPADLMQCSKVDMDKYKNCTVTVGELEECYSELIEYAKTLKCSNISNFIESMPDCMETMQNECSDNK
jgi:hypothetical protein